MGKLEAKKTYVLSSEILETETPKKEKLGKIVTREKLAILQYTNCQLLHLFN